MRQLAAKVTKPRWKIDNPLYLRVNYSVLYYAAKPLQNYRITSRNRLEFWQVSQGFGEVLRNH